MSQRTGLVELVDKWRCSVIAPCRSPGLAGLCSIVDRGALQPLLQRHRVNAKVFRDLLDRHTGFAVPRDANDVIPELSGIGLGHECILPSRP